MRDVAIIGGGPAGSTLATILKKYEPSLDVLILERELFPRDHVGESQLPPICRILDEMGCWDKVEAADFPIKIGATYRWGQTRDLWDFEFIPAQDFEAKARPGTYEGQRTYTAFQVDRAVYDKILLDHAAENGVEVRQQAKVLEVKREGNRVLGLKMHSGETVEARYYVDCTGNSAILRRAMGVELDEPEQLRNIAIWDYWDDAQWAFSTGFGGTRIQIMSLGYGWLWFIPISPTRTSIGLVCPVEYYRKSEKRPDDLYLQAIDEEPMISHLTKGAKAEGKVRTTKDWSYIAKNLYGENWFLAGESAGFADPILSAGLTLAHAGGRELGYTIIQLDQGEYDAEWLKRQYQENQQRRVHQHIRFANFWYTANGIFTDLKEMTRDIARDAGLELDAHQAFQWLGTGGFVNELNTGYSGFSLTAVHDTVSLLLQQKTQFEVTNYNQFHLKLDGATIEKFAIYESGKIDTGERFVRAGKSLPRFGFFNVLCQILEKGNDLGFIVHHMIKSLTVKGIAKTSEEAIAYGVPFLESMLVGGWVRGTLDPAKPKFNEHLPRQSSGIKLNDDTFDPAATGSGTTQFWERA